MIKLIVGKKGSGKTKILLDMVNAAAKETSGNVVCVEKDANLTFDVDYSVRLLDADNYSVAGYDVLYGFLSGLLAGNYDITEIFVDGTLRMVGREYEKLGEFFERIDKVAEEANTKLIFTISADESELPDSVKKYI